MDLQLEVSLHGDVPLAGEGALPDRAPSSIPKVVGIELGRRNADSDVGRASLLATVHGAPSVNVVLVKVFLGGLIEGASVMGEKGE